VDLKCLIKKDDIETDIEELGKNKRFNAFCKEYGKDLTLIEPGKFLVSEAGSF
jgi:diaminopimelate decarboxylase